MNEILMRRGDPRAALSHLALYGLGAILEDAGHDVRLSWTPEIRTRPLIAGPDLDPDKVGAAVREHAARLTDGKSWISQNVNLDASARGLMSPRISTLNDQTWPLVQRERRQVLDELTDSHSWLDLRLIGALGEPCYWSWNRQGVLLQDDGASRWEMQPRNQGSEIVGTRLRKLAAAVAARDNHAVLAGLAGLQVRDEVGRDAADSSTATGLAAVGPVDNAGAWCALWGISQLPIAPRINRKASTTGHIGRSRHEWFYGPVWHEPWRPARLRSMLASRALQLAAWAGLTEPNSPSPLQIEAAQAWLAARRVAGLMRFPIARTGSDKAPIRRAHLGQPIYIGPPDREAAA